MLRCWLDFNWFGVLRGGARAWREFGRSVESTRGYGWGETAHKGGMDEECGGGHWVLGAGMAKRKTMLFVGDAGNGCLPVVESFKVTSCGSCGHIFNLKINKIHSRFNF